MSDVSHLFHIDSQRCFADAVDGAGLSQAGFAAAREALAPRLDTLSCDKAEGSLPLLSVPEQRDDLPAVEQGKTLARDYLSRMAEGVAA